MTTEINNLLKIDLMSPLVVRVRRIQEISRNRWPRHPEHSLQHRTIRQLCDGLVQSYGVSSADAEKIAEFMHANNISVSQLAVMTEKEINIFDTLQVIAPHSKAISLLIIEKFIVYGSKKGVKELRQEVLPKKK
jgi:hypothetical protein